MCDSELLSRAARQAIIENEAFASVANLWELLLKRSKKDALLADPLPWWNKYVVRAGVPVLPIRNSHVSALATLPDVHKDPFDRILLAQAIVEKASLVTKDQVLAAYGVPLLW